MGTTWGVEGGWSPAEGVHDGSACRGVATLGGIGGASSGRRSHTLPLSSSHHGGGAGGGAAHWHRRPGSVTSGSRRQSAAMGESPALRIDRRYTTPSWANHPQSAANTHRAVTGWAAARPALTASWSTVGGLSSAGGRGGWAGASGGVVGRCGGAEDGGSYACGGYPAASVAAAAAPLPRWEGRASGDGHSNGCRGPTAPRESPVTATPPLFVSSGATGSSGGPGGDTVLDDNWLRRAESVPPPLTSSWQRERKNDDGASPTTTATSHTATSPRLRRDTGGGSGGGDEGGGGESVNSRTRRPVRDALCRLLHRNWRKVGGRQEGRHPSRLASIEGKGEGRGMAVNSDSSSYRSPAASEWSAGGVGGSSHCEGWCRAPTTTPPAVAAADGWAAAVMERQVRAAASTRMVAAAAAEAVETASWATTMGGRPLPRGTA